MLAPDAKDIVIMIDRSNFMRTLKGGYEIARNAAMDIIGKLESYDKVGDYR